MSLALTLPLVGLLIGLPGIPGFSKLHKLRLPHKAEVDSLPPVWKPYSLLALEDEYLIAAPREHRGRDRTGRACADHQDIWPNCSHDSASDGAGRRRDRRRRADRRVDQAARTLARSP